jgi:hypothetical protein
MPLPSRSFGIDDSAVTATSEATGSRQHQRRKAQDSKKGRRANPNPCSDHDPNARTQGSRFVWCSDAILIIQCHSYIQAVPELRRLVAGFPSRRPGFEQASAHVVFVVDKVALGQVFSEYFGFHCQFSFHRQLHTHHLSSGAGIIGQLVADVTSGLSLTPPQETKKKKKRGILSYNFQYPFQCMLLRLRLLFRFEWRMFPATFLEQSYRLTLEQLTCVHKVWKFIGHVLY